MPVFSICGKMIVQKNICLHYKTFRYTEKIKSYPKYQKLDIRKYISFIQEGMELTYKRIAESKVELINLFEKYKNNIAFTANPPPIQYITTGFYINFTILAIYQEIIFFYNNLKIIPII